MRIAIYHNLPSGGAKRALQELVKGLGPRHHVDVFTLSSADHGFADLRPHVNGHAVVDFQPLPLFRSPWGRLNQLMRAADLLRLRQLTRRLAQTLAHGEYDVAFVQPCRFEVSPSLLSWLQAVPTVYFCQEPLRRVYEPMPARPYEQPRDSWRRWLDRLDPLPGFYHLLLKQADRHNVRQADRVLVNSHFIRRAVNRVYGVEAHVSYLGVDVRQFRPLGLTREGMVLSVGSLTPLKGFDFLIRALARLPAADRPRLAIASNFQNPPERDYLRQLAAELAVDLALLGNVSDQRLVELYNQAQVTVYAPIREPFGLVALESMACGTPVIAVREGGTQETVLHEQTGLLVRRDEREFAEALARLLSNPAQAREYGQAGREHVARHWSWSRAVSTLEGHLEMAIQSRLQPLGAPLPLHESQ